MEFFKIHKAIISLRHVCDVRLVTGKEESGMTVEVCLDLTEVSGDELTQTKYVFTNEKAKAVWGYFCDKAEIDLTPTE